eukprot:Lithocolla_globosa_v1_NODE_5772_length_1187_cov_6.322438.p1 type:complete len:299 gc:universal NODE_5772_length_1187_cov_6.322438:943-47(-)
MFCFCCCCSSGCSCCCNCSIPNPHSKLGLKSFERAIKTKQLPPLFQFEHCDVKPCELHLRIRISERILKVMIEHAIHLDKKETKKSADALSRPTLRALVKVINDDCNVNFNVWKTEKQGKDYDFTSVMGPGKLNVMEKIGKHLHKVFNTEFAEKYKFLWDTFFDLYQQIREKITFVGKVNFRRQVASFLNAFLRLGAHGTTTDDITPYMHILWAHVADEMDKGCIHRYTGQGVEGLNEVHRRTFSHKSNKWNPQYDCILVELRQHYLERSGRVRIKNKYEVKCKVAHSNAHKRKKEKV